MYYSIYSIDPNSNCTPNKAIITTINETINMIIITITLNIDTIDLIVILLK